jgi:hypothetical protein
MATKVEYLTDIREHPQTTGGEAAARLDVPEATILEGYRRARRQGLVEGDGSRPEKFVLTETGLQQLRNLPRESNPTADLPRNVEGNLSALEKKVNETIENVKGLSGLVDQILSAKRGSAARDTDTLADDLHEQVVTLGDALKKRSQVLEFYAVRLAQAPFNGKAKMLEARKSALASQLDSDAQEEINRLVAVEADLAEENNKFFGPARDVARQLATEIGRLRGKYGFPSIDLGEAGEAENDADKELLG